MSFRKIFLLCFMTGALSACSLFQERPGLDRFIGPREDVIYAHFEEVWRATNLVLQAYPLRLSNMDDGLLETDDIKGVRAWEPPFHYKKPAGMTYRLTIRVVRGLMGQAPATKVIILKDMRVQPDFFSDTKQVPTDGLEENSLIYRIKREVQIERALNTAQKTKSG